ncbi:MAG: hypothetical protein IJ634_05510 [Bacteroidales bacterium]|nr:hypothetical protein [Bacteroidales bacterium]
MKHLFSVVLVAALFAGCNLPLRRVLQTNETPINCEVDPDAVFGRHYTAADFQIWKVADGYEVDRMLVDTKLPDTLFFEDTRDFTRLLLIKTEDTATVGAAVRPLCRQRGWYPLWGDADAAGFQVLYILVGKPLLDGTSVAKAEACVWDGRNEVRIELKKEHHADWQRITRESIGHCLAFTLGDRMLMAPMVNGEITGGKMFVSGGYTEDMCCAMAAVLN